MYISIWLNTLTTRPQAYAKLSAMDGMVDPLQKDHDGHLDRVTELEMKLAEMHRSTELTLVDWKAKYEALCAEVDPLRQERDALKARNEEMSHEIARLHEEAASSQRILEEIQIKEAKRPGGILSPIRKH